MVGDTILIKDISINGNENLNTASELSETLTNKTINALGIDASSRTIWINGQPYGNAYVNIKEGGIIEKPIGGEIFNDFEHNIASGDYSHAEGQATEASGNTSHAEGNSSKATGIAAHAEGEGTEASARSAHAEGKGTIATNEAEHAEGKYNKSNTNTIHSVGIGTYVNDRKNAIEVMQNGDVYINDIGGYNGTNPSESKDLATILSTVDTSDNNSFIIENDLKVNRNTTIGGTLEVGSNTTIRGKVAMGSDTNATGVYSHAEGNNTTATGAYSHTEGEDTIASGQGSHAEGYNTETGGEYEKNEKSALDTGEPGMYSHAEGNATISQGPWSHAEGKSTFAQVAGAHAEGLDSTASGAYSHAEGLDTTASAYVAHAEGQGTMASGIYSHAEGNATTAQGRGSHAEGFITTANGDYSHAEGQRTTANGNYSHVTGSYNIAEGDNSTLQGYYLFDHGVDVENSFIWLMSVNVKDEIIGAGFIRIIQPFIVVPGESTSDVDPRKNCYEVRGSLWVGVNKPEIQEVMKYDTTYYIPTSKLDDIISSWNTNTPEQLTLQFRIFEYSEETRKLSPIGGVFKGAALFGDGAENWNGSGSLGKTLYESYITTISGLGARGSIGSIAIKNAYEEERPNSKPVRFTNNNATIVGQYNKPQPTDIFEVGCGGYNSQSEIIQQNAISVRSNGETAIPNLTSTNANIKDLISTNVRLTNLHSDQIKVGTPSNQSGVNINTAIKFLPAGIVSTDTCQTYICRDGILIGYSQRQYVYLSITTAGTVLIKKRWFKGEYQDTESTANINWSDIGISLPEE